jgi:hypothetical protein
MLQVRVELAHMRQFTTTTLNNMLPHKFHKCKFPHILQPLAATEKHFVQHAAEAS